MNLTTSVLEVARDLLGNELVRQLDDGTRLRARVVETEAYREGDPASHSCNGRTERSAVMFGPPGHWYIYKCYGMHWMINLVCGAEGQGQAVLIRAAEPLQGVLRMEKHRGLSGRSLTNGPGKLAGALAVDKTFNEKPAFAGDDFYLESGATPDKIYESPRVGISVATDRNWRFYCDNKYVSQVSENGVGRCRN